jgi:magnesium chelatase subunit I
VLNIYKARISPAEVKDIVGAFEGGLVVHTGEDVSSAELGKLVTQVPSIRATVIGLTDGDESPAAVASAVEFILEGLHLSKRLNKDVAGSKATYRSRV